LLLRSRRCHGGPVKTHRRMRNRPAACGNRRRFHRGGSLVDQVFMSVAAIRLRCQA
jgi:hypothetical protein